MSSKKAIRSDSRKSEQYRSTSCLNCGQALELTDMYCPSCSQLNTTKQLSIKDFFGEFLSSLFTYDSRLRYTLKDLLLKPGIISKNYVRGQRLKYANPFPFFLSVSIAFFILQGIINNLNIDNPSMGFTLTNDGKVVENSEEFLDSIQMAEEEKKILAKKEALKKEIDGNVPLTVYLTESQLDSIAWHSRGIERFFEYRKFYKNTEIKNPEKALYSIGHENTGMNRWMYSKNKSLDRISENPGGFANYIFSKVPFFLFLFSPVFAFFFWLLYSRKKYNFMEHLIFIFHIFSFVFLVLVLSLIPDLIIGIDLFSSIGLIIIGPLYFYLALRKFYEQSRLITFFKFVILNVLFFLNANLAALIFFIASAAVY